MSQKWEHATQDGHHSDIREEVLIRIKTLWRTMQETEVRCEQCRYQRASRLEGDPAHVRCLCLNCATNARLDRGIAHQHAMNAERKARARR
jgi:hypothetical protein